MRAILEQKHRFVESRVEHVRMLGDAVLSAFFAEDKPKAREKHRATIESWVASIGSTKWDELMAAADSLRAGKHPLSPFHWAIEFPEVFGVRIQDSMPSSAILLLPEWSQPARATGRDISTGCRPASKRPW